MFTGQEAENHTHSDEGYLLTRGERGLHFAPLPTPSSLLSLRAMSQTDTCPVSMVLKLSGVLRVTGMAELAGTEWV